MKEAFDSLWKDLGAPAFSCKSAAAKAQALATANLLCMGKRTVANLLCAGGLQFQDWSAHYRIFSREKRFDQSCLFSSITRYVAEGLPGDAPFCAFIDDTEVRKRGRKVHGAKWRADRKGPKFQCNLVWAQRYVQISAAVPEAAVGPCGARLLPIEFHHAPNPEKPKPGADAAQVEAYKKRCSEEALPMVAAQSLRRLRQNLDEGGHATRPLIVAGDAGFTNRTILKNLPERTTYIGRVRKDAKIFAPPDPAQIMGRPRLYGERLPTPEEIRRDADIAWQQVKAFAAGKVHSFQVKSRVVRWAPTGGRDIRLVVIKPLAYLPPGSRNTCYREPVYLIVTDPALPLESVLQNYIWRWETEVNFRDEKKLLGAGDAHVRCKNSTEKLPAFLVAVYALLHLACQNAGAGECDLPRPKWRSKKPPRRITTQQAITAFRASAWDKELGLKTFNHFDPKNGQITRLTNPHKVPTPFQSAVLYPQMC